MLVAALSRLALGSITACRADERPAAGWKIPLAHVSQFSGAVKRVKGGCETSKSQGAWAADWVCSQDPRCKDTQIMSTICLTKHSNHMGTLCPTTLNPPPSLFSPEQPPPHQPPPRISPFQGVPRGAAAHLRAVVLDGLRLVDDQQAPLEAAQHVQVAPRSVL